MPNYEIDPQKLLVALGGLGIAETRTYLMNRLSEMVGGVCDVPWAQPVVTAKASRTAQLMKKGGYTEPFEAFWKEYPARNGMKAGKGAAFKAWCGTKVNEEQLLTLCLLALEKQKVSESWTKDGGQFIPMASTYLNGRRWEDEMGDVQTEEMYQDINGNWRKKT